MRKATHMTGGAVAWLAVAAVAHPALAVTLPGAVVAAVAAPLNDIDNVGAWSKFRRYSRRRQPVRHRLSRWGLYPRFRKHPVKVRVARAVGQFGEHREGPAHSLLVAAALGAGLAVLLGALGGPWWWLGVAVAVGLGSHIVLDKLNDRPVRALWPFGKGGCLYLMPVGGKREALLGVVLAVAGVWLGVMTLRGLK